MSDSDLWDDEKERLNKKNSSVEVLRDKIDTLNILKNEIENDKQWNIFLGEEYHPSRKEAIEKRIKAFEDACLALEKQKKLEIIIDDFAKNCDVDGRCILFKFTDTDLRDLKKELLE